MRASLTVYSFLINLERRDFLREAVFLFKVFPLTALSSALWTSAIAFSASFFLPEAISFLRALIDRETSSLRRRLKTRFLSELRCAFLAPRVIDMRGILADFAL